MSEAECSPFFEQDELRVELDRTVPDNPDLPIDFIRDILIAKATDRELAEPFTPE